MKKAYFTLFIFVIFIMVTTFLTFNGTGQKNLESPKPERDWVFKSIDTMKYSRDLSVEKLNNTDFDKEINEQLKLIRGLSATHVAIGTPYDERFRPVLKRWVESARKNHLKVWFRGNFSSWEGWFGQEKNSVSREEHTQLTRDFIKNNPDLFKNGDIFSSCPECENGGPGDPRENGDVSGHRSFLIAERNAALEEFQKIGKKVTVLDSMNFDVAKLIMNRETARAMGNIVAIDHYVKSPQKLGEDIDFLHRQTGAQIFLGELGVPIPDIHGNLTQEDQAKWIEEALNLLGTKEEVIGLNYWVAVGGSTALFSDSLSPKLAADVVKKHFSLKDHN